VHIKLYELAPTRSARVRWALQEAALEFESVSNGIAIFDSEELRGIHPLGKIPAVEIGGRPLFESAAIVTAIADLVPDKNLIASPGSWARNLHNQWICFALSEMEPFVQSTEINTMDFVLPADQHVKAIIPQNDMMYRKAASALEKHLSKQKFLVEDRFSVTDIFVAYTLSWGQEQDLLGDFPCINEYMDRLYGREYCTLQKPP